MTKSTFILTLCATLTLASSGTLRAAPFSNAGFDDYTGASNSDLVSGLSPASWVVATDQTNQEWRVRSSWSSGLTPHTGDFWLASSGNDPLAIYQTFDTTPGKQYEISFQVSRANSNASRTPTIFVDVFSGTGSGDLSDDGDLLDDQFTAPIGSFPNTSWTEVTGGDAGLFVFTASSTSSTLRIGEESQSVDAFYDSFVITEIQTIPESSSISLAGIAALVGLFVICRRRS